MHYNSHSDGNKTTIQDSYFDKDYESAMLT